MKEAVRTMFELISYTLNKTPVTEESRENLSNTAFLHRVIKLASYHDLAHIVSHALLENGIVSKEQPREYSLVNNNVMHAVYRYEQMEYVRKSVCSLLEEHKTPYILLKGAVIRELYPEPWMRTSCDIDILVKEDDVEDTIQLITKKLNARTDLSGDHDIPIYFENGVHIELHFSFVDLRIPDFDFLGQVWENAELSEGGSYEYNMPKGLLYINHLAHMVKHIKNGGCGIKPFIDLYLLNKAGGYKNTKLLKQAKLYDFSVSCELLCNAWITGEGYEKINKDFASYIIKGGAYGIDVNKVTQSHNRIHTSSIRSVIVPYERLKYEYKILQNHRWLYPLYAMRRVFRVAFITIPKVIKSDHYPKTDAATKQKTANMMRDIGL